MTRVFRAPDQVMVEDYELPVFLAGSIEMGMADDWQAKVINAFSDVKNLVFLNPRREHWDSSCVQDISNSQFKEQVSWELMGLEDAGITFFYFDPATMSPISMMELGYCIGITASIVVVCPPGFWRRGNVQVICARFGIKVHDSLEDGITALKDVVARANSY